MGLGTSLPVVDMRFMTLLGHARLFNTDRGISHVRLRETVAVYIFS